MGKHKKPRNRRGRNKESKKAQITDSSGPPLLARIRHADPQTRLAALTALAHRPTQNFDMALWQAVCEQVVVRPGCSVAQLSTAAMAATILAEWTSTPAAERNTATMQAQNNLTAGWPLVLQGQLQVCLRAWKDSTTQHRSLWGQCAWQSLYAWTSLIETNPVVMDRLQQQVTTRNDAMQMLKEWLLATTANESATTIAAGNTKDDGELKDLRNKLAETTSRAWHSLLQDNPSVVEPWWDESNDATWMTTHVPTLLQNKESVSPVTRLHLAGVWMTCRNILTDATAFQSPEVLASAVATLQENLVLPTWSDTVENWKQLYDKATEQSQDDMLERQVVRKQAEKKEPARLIARRLAKEKGGVMNMDNDDDNKDNDDMEDEDGVLKPGQLPANRTDHLQNWEDFVQAWESSLRPVELSLEIIAHLTAVAPDDSVMMEESDGDFAMQSADWDPVLKQQLQGLPACLFSCFQALHSCQYTSLPGPLALHWSELQSKSSLGLGHCFAQISRESNAPVALGMPRSHLWQTLWSAVRQTQVASTGRQASLGLIVVALQTHEDMRQEMTPADLELLISLLQSSDESPPVLRECIIILGILCSQEEHAAEVNQAVCSALISRLDKVDESVVVRAEVLNVLMDIYGNDDCHPAIFDKLNVLSHFEKSLPILKDQVSRVDRQTIDSNDLEHWKDVTLNVARFIEYKREQ